ncbi:MAG: hypothetical protein NC084_09695 [Bacteroides sp.]|nr:hypothetical protein [Eubacterium sp.]MCM1419632.1 hypothetical protein [Roseburia sp.]MCM1462970.1 hypothetical protein [Bacteroides sp.]
MSNIVNKFKKYVDKLDTVYQQSAKTAILDGDNALVRMGSNAGEMLIPKLAMDGLGDYDRNAGYAQGSASITFETKACDYDRGRKFTVDAMDNEETSGILFGKLAGEFIRTKAVAELDAYRFARYAAVPGISAVAEELKLGTDVLAALKTAQNVMDENEVDPENRVLFITPTLRRLAREVDKTVSTAILDEFAKVVDVPQTRFYTGITLNDGRADDELTGGFTPTEGAFPINFMVVERSAVIQFTKHNVNKVISPDANQTTDGYLFFYRSYGIASYFDNKVKGIYLNRGTNAFAKETEGTA